MADRPGPGRPTIEGLVVGHLPEHPLGAVLGKDIALPVIDGVGHGRTFASDLACLGKRPEFGFSRRVDLFFLALALLLRLFGRHGTARSQCQHAHHQRREGAPPQHGFWSHLHIPLALSAPQCTGPGRDPTRPATHSAARFAPPELPRIPLHVNHKSAAVATARRGAAARELGAWGAAPRYFGFGGPPTSLLPSPGTAAGRLKTKKWPHQCRPVAATTWQARKNASHGSRKFDCFVAAQTSCCPLRPAVAATGSTLWPLSGAKRPGMRSAPGCCV